MCHVISTVMSGEFTAVIRLDRFYHYAASFELCHQLKVLAC